MPGPKRGVAFTFSVELESLGSPGTFQANPTLATGDVVVEKDGVADGNITTLPSVLPAGGTSVEVVLDASEMTVNKYVKVLFADAAGNEWKPLHVTIIPDVILTDDLDARLPAVLVGGRIDASVGAVAANTLTASALAADAVAEIADGVWDEAISGHLSGGSTGAALNSAGSAGDPWGTALPGAYTAGSAGHIVGTNLNAKVGDVEADTANIQTRLPGSLVSGRMDASVGAMATDTVTAAALAADAVTEIQAGLSTLNAVGVRTAVGLASANLDTQLGDLPTNAELTAALAAVDDAVLAAIATLNNLSAAQVNAEVDTALADVGLTTTVTGRMDAAVSTRAATGAAMALTSGERSTLIAALLDLVDGIEAGLTPRNALRLLAAACAGKASGLATTTAVYRNAVADSANRIVATVDADGNRTAVVVDLT